MNYYSLDLPEGGELGQTLVKSSGDNYDTEWADGTPSPDARIPNDTTAGNYLRFSTTNGGIEERSAAQLQSDLGIDDKLDKPSGNPSEDSLVQVDNAGNVSYVSPSGITDLSDLPQDGATDGQVITWNNTDSEWEAADPTGTGGGTVTVIDVSGGAQDIPDQSIAWVSATQQYVNDTGAEVTGVDNTTDFTVTGWLQLGDGQATTGSGITQVTADGRYLQQTNNLSDLNNADTAITNLGLTKGSGSIITDAERLEIGTTDINGLTAESAAVAADEFIIYDVSAGENRKISLTQLQALAGWTGGTTPPAVVGDLTSITIDNLTFTGAGATANIVVSGDVGTNFNLSIVTTTPLGWLTAGTLGATSGTIPADGTFETTIVIPVVTTTVTRTAAIQAINTADATDIVTTGLFTQSHTAPVSNGNLTIDASSSIVGTTATFSVDVTAGDPNFTAVLYDENPATTGMALETMTATALGVITFTGIDTSTLTAGTYRYYIQVTDNDGDVVTEAETFTITAATPVSSVYGEGQPTLRGADTDDVVFYNRYARTIWIYGSDVNRYEAEFFDLAGDKIGNTFTAWFHNNGILRGGTATNDTDYNTMRITDTSVSPNTFVDWTFHEAPNGGTLNADTIQNAGVIEVNDTSIVLWYQGSIQTAELYSDSNYTTLVNTQTLASTALAMRSITNLTASTTYYIKIGGQRLGEWTTTA